jgi:hypothetical protein
MTAIPIVEQDDLNGATDVCRKRWGAPEEFVQSTPEVAGAIAKSAARSARTEGAALENAHRSRTSRTQRA